MGTMSEFAGKHVLVIVENLPVPFDRRVWQEANALKDAGAQVSIICPKMRGFNASRETLNGIEIYRHPLPTEGAGAIGYLLEYGIAIFFQLLLATRIYLKNRFHVIQGCNPPDLIFLVALFFRPFGVRYVFDHHDINPELYIAKFGRQDFFYRLMVMFERMTFRFASHSIATNESYRQIAISRGGMAPERVHVVRSGPNVSRLVPGPGKPEFKNGRKYLVGYIGVIGEQEGLDLLLESVRSLVSRRQDVQFSIIGDGTALAGIKQMAFEMGVSDFVAFHGRVSDQDMLDILNAADVCVNPDRPTEMNDLSTMNKIMEYMALGKPIVQYSLKEGRFSAGEASLYAANTDPEDFASKIETLLDDESLRARMGAFGRERVVNELSWDYEQKRLIAAYRAIFRDAS